MGFDPRHLSQLTIVPDLPRLVAALGHEPLWDELEPTAWAPARSVSLRRAAVVGRAGGFTWFGAEASEASLTAQRLAAAQSRRGGPAGFLVCDPEHRRLAISVSWEAAPTLSLDLDAPGRLALTTLARIKSLPARSATGFAVGLAEALGAEGLGRRFFSQFRLTAERMSSALVGPADPELRHGYVLLQLTRVLFLYFIQCKGWLAGDEQFLGRHVEQYLSERRALHRRLLLPLFFGTLNRRVSERGTLARGFGRVPFLNGGLFEPHALDRRFPGGIADAQWRDAFDDLFERFHFTVQEGEPSGIAPDMLGRVFEGLMAADDRRVSGTFYTPAALVNRVLDSALHILVASKLDCDADTARSRVSAGDRSALDVLREATLLDPAAGSGAFLLGALERLTTLICPDPAGRNAERRRILRESLFGVDLSAAAVRLAELRLWLAVIADDPADHPADIAPLPNLDCVVRQGDSLADPFGWLAPGSGKSAADVGRLRRQAVAASGSRKRQLLTALRRGELAAVTGQLDDAIQAAEAAAREYLAAARSPTLFGEARGLDRQLRSQLNAARRRLRELRSARRRLGRTGELPWFHYQGHFAEVFVRGGFDLVMGNPPWVRAESLPPETRSRLAERYRWWRGQGQGWAHRPDLSVAFVERAWELAAPGGLIALLVPAKLTSAGYGAAARHGLAASGTLHLVANLGAAAARQFNATVYPLVLIAQKSAPPPDHRVGISLGGKAGPAQSTLGSAPWVLTSDAAQSALRSLLADHPTLGNRIVAHLGVKTGANEVFLDPDNVEPELLRWAVRGRDVAPFICRPRRRLLWTHDARGRPRPRLPPRAAAYLERHSAALKARRDYAGGPPWTLFRTAGATGQARVIWADLARRLTAVPLTEEQSRMVPLNTCYVAVLGRPEQALALSAWLNSSWIRGAAQLTASPAAGGFARFTSAVVSALPLPDGVLDDSQLAALAQNAAAGRMAQEELDDCTARYLALDRRAAAQLAEMALGRADDRGRAAGVGR